MFAFIQHVLANTNPALHSLKQLMLGGTIKTIKFRNCMNVTSNDTG